MKLSSMTSQPNTDCDLVFQETFATVANFDMRLSTADNFFRPPLNAVLINAQQLYHTCT